MKIFGGIFLLFGIGSVVLVFFGQVFTLLSWIDNWGPTVGWAIRGGLIVVGAALWFLGSAGTNQAAE